MKEIRDEGMDVQVQEGVHRKYTTTTWREQMRAVHGIGVPQRCVSRINTIFRQLGRWHVGGKVHNNGDRAEGTDGECIT